MKRIVFIILLIALCSCGKKESPDATPVLTQTAPDKAVLTAPASNSTCTIGRVISATQSGILFSWNASTNTDSYDLVIKNLLIGVATTQTVAATQLEVTLLRNTPYSWYVVSKSAKTTQTAQSGVFKFYNQGNSTTYYAPFPADLNLPTMGQSLNATAGKITLTWTGASVDNDIVGYDVYVGTGSSTLSLTKQNLVASSFDIAVTSGTSYYWKVITKDAQGNMSTSDVYQFNVN